MTTLAALAIFFAGFGSGILFAVYLQVKANKGGVNGGKR